MVLRHQNGQQQPRVLGRKQIFMYTSLWFRYLFLRPMGQSTGLGHLQISLITLPSLKPVLDTLGFPMCPKDHSKQLHYLARGSFWGLPHQEILRKRKGICCTMVVVEEEMCIWDTDRLWKPMGSFSLHADSQSVPMTGLNAVLVGVAEGKRQKAALLRRGT